MSFKFTPNQAGIDRLMKGPGMRDFVTGEARRVESLAVASAPVDTGDYRASIGSSPADVTADGVTATVYSTDPAALIIEFGTSDTPPFRTLSSAVTAAGLKFKG